MRRLKKYLTLLTTSIQQTAAYRSNFFISILVTAILFISSFFLWKSVFVGQDTLSSYTWASMKAYLLAAFICNTLLSWYSESSISRKILDGSVAMDLTKPYDFYFARLAETLGSSVFEALVIAAVSVILTFTLRIPVPSEPLRWLCFFISIVLALIIKFEIVYLFSLCTFMTTSYIGIQWSRAAVTNLLSGGLVPLSFFPEGIRRVFDNLPFHYIVALPASIFLGQTELSGMGYIFAEELVWVLILFVLGKLFFSLCIRKVTINGG